MRDDVDRARTIRVLALAASRFDWRVLAHCLMTNHFHLVIATPKPNLHEGMHFLKGTVARQFNRRHGRTGPVFEKRYDATAAESDRHLLEVCRYAVLNPERAGLVDDPAAWPWSSYNVTARGDTSTFVAVNEVLRLFDPHDLERAAAMYRAFVAEGCARRAA